MHAELLLPPPPVAFQATGHHLSQPRPSREAVIEKLVVETTMRMVNGREIPTSVQKSGPEVSPSLSIHSLHPLSSLTFSLSGAYYSPPFSCFRGSLFIPTTTPSSRDLPRFPRPRREVGIFFTCLSPHTHHTSFPLSGPLPSPFGKQCEDLLLVLARLSKIYLTGSREFFYLPSIPHPTPSFCSFLGVGVGEQGEVLLPGTCPDDSKLFPLTPLPLTTFFFVVVFSLFFCHVLLCSFICSVLS